MSEPRSKCPAARKLVRISDSKTLQAKRAPGTPPPDEHETHEDDTEETD